MLSLLTFSHISISTREGGIVIRCTYAHSIYVHVIFGSFFDYRTFILFFYADFGNPSSTGPLVATNNPVPTDVSALCALLFFCILVRVSMFEIPKSTCKSCGAHHLFFIFCRGVPKKRNLSWIVLGDYDSLLQRFCYLILFATICQIVLRFEYNRRLKLLCWNSSG